jgi:hypothetical protein
VYLPQGNHGIVMEEFSGEWLRQLLKKDFPQLSITDIESIIRWLFDRELWMWKQFMAKWLKKICPARKSIYRFYPYILEKQICYFISTFSNPELTNITPSQFQYSAKMRDYRYRLLQRYLEVNPTAAYGKLMARLGSLVWHIIIKSVATSRDRKGSFTDVLSAVIHELLQSDSHIQQEIKLINECTCNPTLRNTLSLTVIEEYCRRPMKNQPLIAYRVINYLKRDSRGGLTYVPEGQSVRLVSDNVTTEENDNFLSLIDYETIKRENNPQPIYDEECLRTEIKEKFAQYLAEKFGTTAARWLELHLQCKKPSEIASALNCSDTDVYRLRDKICYHARGKFASLHWELIHEWLNG